MKYQQFIFKIILGLFIFLASPLKANDLISVYADYEKITVTNTFHYTLKIHFIRPNGSYQSQTLRPGSSFSFKGRYKKRKLKNYIIALDYDEDTYSLDKIAIQNTMNRILREREANARAKALLNFLGEAAASSDNSFLSFLGNTYNFSQDVVEGINLYNKLQEGDYLAAKGIVESYAGTKAAVELGGELANEMGLSKGFGKGTTSAMITLAKELENKSMPRQLRQYQDGAAILYHDRNFYKNNTFFVNEILDSYRFPKYLPNIIMTISPFTMGKTFDNWRRPDERFVKDDDNNGESEWGRGTINNSLSANFAFPLSREMGVGKVHSKFYLNISYHNVAYRLAEEELFLLGGSVVQGLASDDFDLISQPNKVTFNHNSNNAGLMLRFGGGGGFSFDMEGGYSYNRGFLKFPKGGEHLSSGNEPISKKIEIFSKNSHNPYGTIRIGYGLLNYQMILEAVVSKPNLILLEEYQLYRITSIDEINNTYTQELHPIEAEDDFIYRINIGFSLTF